MIEQELVCSICLELLNQPTTLICGHTFCKPCVQHLYYSYKKCALCKIVIDFIPGINIILNNIINSDRNPTNLIEQLNINMTDENKCKDICKEISIQTCLNDDVRDAHVSQKSATTFMECIQYYNLSSDDIILYYILLCIGNLSSSRCMSKMFMDLNIYKQLVCMLKTRNTSTKIVEGIFFVARALNHNNQLDEHQILNILNYIKMCKTNEDSRKEINLFYKQAVQNLSDENLFRIINFREHFQ